MRKRVPTVPIFFIFESNLNLIKVANHEGGMACAAKPFSLSETGRLEAVKPLKHTYFIPQGVNVTWPATVKSR
ncbi:unannotated protein [freshwater metagenome]|uniref:Unannotated protein n=1 Tax=freshwater metagenome TaxID=449393 RepID=A0A6J6NNI5_9ZZZZ